MSSDLPDESLLIICEVNDLSTLGLTKSPYGNSCSKKQMQPTITWLYCNYHNTQNYQGDRPMESSAYKQKNVSNLTPVQYFFSVVINHGFDGPL